MPTITTTTTNLLNALVDGECAEMNAYLDYGFQLLNSAIKVKDVKAEMVKIQAGNTGYGTLKPTVVGNNLSAALAIAKHCKTRKEADKAIEESNEAAKTESYKVITLAQRLGVEKKKRAARQTAETRAKNATVAVARMDDVEWVTYVRAENARRNACVVNSTVKVASQ